MKNAIMSSCTTQIRAIPDAVVWGVEELSGCIHSSQDQTSHYIKNCKEMVRITHFILIVLLCNFNVVSGQKKKIVYDTASGEYSRIGNEVTYNWVYKDSDGATYNLSFSIIFNRGWHYMQEVYKKKNHDHGNYTRFIKNDPFKNDLKVLADQLQKLANRHGISETELALSFVQALPYQETMEGYQRYSVETLIDAKGDCSDTSVLFAGILAVWNYDCIFLNFPDHLAVGIWSESIPGGSYWRHRGRRFYFCETTGTGWRIGFGADDWNTTDDIEEVNFY